MLSSASLLRRLRPARGEAGFTLLELLIVVIVIGVLAAIALPVFLTQQAAAYDASAQSDVRNTVSQVVAFEALDRSQVNLTAAGYVEAGGKLVVSPHSHVGLVIGSAGSYTVCGWNEKGGKYKSAATAWQFDSRTGKSAQLSTGECKYALDEDHSTPGTNSGAPTTPAPGDDPDLTTSPPSNPTNPTDPPSDTVPVPPTDNLEWTVFEDFDTNMHGDVHPLVNSDGDSMFYYNENTDKGIVQYDTERVHTGAGATSFPMALDGTTASYEMEFNGLGHSGLYKHALVTAWLYVDTTATNWQVSFGPIESDSWTQPANRGRTVLTGSQKGRWIPVEFEYYPSSGAKAAQNDFLTLYTSSDLSAGGGKVYLDDLKLYHYTS